MFDVLGELFAESTFRGCAFQNASAESRPGGAVQEVSDTARAWTRSLFTDLAREAGVAEPDVLARQFQLLYDGATVSARMDRDPTAAVVARAVAVTVLDAALSP